MIDGRTVFLAKEVPFVFSQPVGYLPFFFVSKKVSRRNYYKYSYSVVKCSSSPFNRLCEFATNRNEERLETDMTSEQLTAP